MSALAYEIWPSDTLRQCIPLISHVIPVMSQIVLRDMRSAIKLMNGKEPKDDVNVKCLEIKLPGLVLFINVRIHNTLNKCQLFGFQNV